MSKLKKHLPAAEARRLLSRVPPHKSFWLCTNDETRSLKEIVRVLDRIDDDIFRYHVNRDKNDFEEWIRDVANDKELAREISRVKTKETLHRKIRERVDALSAVVRAANRNKRKVVKRRRTREPVKRLRKRVARRKAAKKRVRSARRPVSRTRKSLKSVRRKRVVRKKRRR